MFGSVLFLLIIIAQVYSINEAFLEYSKSSVQRSSNRAIDQEFQVELRIRVPTQILNYRPSLGEVLKHGWMQYLSLLVLVYLVLKPFYSSLIENQIVKTMPKRFTAVNE
jgi:hypothetical protein